MLSAIIFADFMVSWYSNSVTDKGGSIHQFSPQIASEAWIDVVRKMGVPSGARGTNSNA
ncbi:MAG: hypothetical protein ABIL20_08860 [candidate division WOR-3 bacterium]